MTKTRARLDAPRDLRRKVMRAPNIAPDFFGKFSEDFARYMGTASFLLWMTLFVIVYIVWNTLLPKGDQFDPYSFTFLTLVLSLQASYAAPLILLAQNRQEARDRVVAEQDRRVNAQAQADMEFLSREIASLRMALREVATRDFVRSELRGLLEDLDERAAVETENEDPSPAK